MKHFRRFLRYFLILVLLLALAGFLFVWHLKPDYSGSRVLNGLADSVHVAFDSYGIPHISAASEADAFRALGYVHAQDRLWQMELLRRVARGGLSEVFGERTLDTDRFFLTLEIDQASREIVEGLDPDSPEFRLTRAYLDGINAFIAGGPTPPEYYLVGLDKTPFDMVDVYNTLGYMAFSFAMAHKTDPLLTGIGEDPGPEYLNELLGVPEGRTRIPVFGRRDTTSIQTIAAGSEIRDLLEQLPVPMLEGSNSWVIGGDKTQSGQVLFANDPHIGFAQPSVWYEAHIRAPGYEKYGYHLGGVPFPLLGHDKQAAYGMTMFENDDIDFFQEHMDPSDSLRYRRTDGWKRLEEVSRRIAVKGSDSVEFKYYRSDIGPVVNPVIPSLSGQPPVSLSWVYTEPPFRVLDALYGISHATDITEFEASVADIHAPGLNVMYGDSSGNIAWWAAARLYRYPDSISTKTFLDGSLAGPGFRSPIQFKDNPQAKNPPWGYVYSANNQPDSTAAGLFPGYYLPENRALRIESLLESRDDWNARDVQEMILDVVSPVDVAVVSELSRHLDVPSLDDSQTECVDALNHWDGSYTLESQQSLLYQRWLYQFLKNTFEDELGPDRFAALLDTHLIKRLIATMAAREHSVWWDDVHTEDTVETKTQIVSKSFRQAMASVEQDFGADSDNWRWGSVHSLESKHALGSVPVLGRFLNVGPFEVPGTREVINNLAFRYNDSGFYSVTSGPSTRRVIDFSDIGSSVGILPTGQSGNPFSSHYDDQAELYVNGEFRPMLLDEEAIARDTKNVLIFVPE